MKTRILAMAAAAATLSFGALMAAPAGAAVALVSGQESCNLYSSTGCLFSSGGGGEFDDPTLIVAAYNASHNPTPVPENLPTLTYLDKQDDGQALSGNGFDLDFVDNGTEWIFTNLPYSVSYYTVKTGSSNFLLFGIAPPGDDLTARNLVIKNGNSPNFGDISHVSFFSGACTAGSGCGGITEIPVPEPATWAMMIMGFGGVGALIRRRRFALA